MLRQIRYTAAALVFALSPLYIQPTQADADVDHAWEQQYKHHANHDGHGSEDPVILSFSTVGDSRQDSKKTRSHDPARLRSGQKLVAEYQGVVQNHPLC